MTNTISRDEFIELCVKIHKLPPKDPQWQFLLGLASKAEVDGDVDGSFKAGALHRIYSELEDA